MKIFICTVFLMFLNYVQSGQQQSRLNDPAMMSTSRRQLPRVYRVDEQFFLETVDGRLIKIAPHLAARMGAIQERSFISQGLNKPTVKHQSAPVEYFLKNGDVVHRGHEPVGTVREQKIYKTDRDGVEHIEEPKSGDIVTKSGGVVAKYENGMFREWNPHQLIKKQI